MTTAADYETALEKYIPPRSGAVRLTDIRAGTLEVWRKELSPSTVGRKLPRAVDALGAAGCEILTATAPEASALPKRSDELSAGEPRSMV